MSRSHAPRWPLLLAVAGVVALLAGVARLLLVWQQNGASAADPEASVLGVVLAAAGTAAALAGWAANRRRIAGLPATAEQLDLAAATLAGAVREQWTAEAQARSLDDPEPMPVRWRLSSPDLMDHPEVIEPDAVLVFDEQSDRIGQLAAAFKALRRRRLVITGGPGTGKTTLAVQLLLELLPSPGEGPSGPVPVLFSLLSWDPTRQPRVQDWLASQLEQTYPALGAIGADAAAGLAAQARVLPILDGLDEVPPVRAAAIIAALNTSLSGGVVLTSRDPQYRSAISDAGAPAHRRRRDRTPPAHRG